MPIGDEIPVFRYSLIDYAGTAFLMGAGGGSVFHLIKGFRNSPSGGRLAGAARAVRTNVPRIAARYGAFGAVYCTTQTAVSLARRRDKEEDYWGTIAAAAAASGLFVVRQGAAVAAGAALFGAAYVAGLDAIDVCVNRFFSGSETQRYRPLLEPVVTEGEKGQLEGHQILLYGEKFEATPEDARGGSC